MVTFPTLSGWAGTGSRILMPDKLSGEQALLINNKAFIIKYLAKKKNVAPLLKTKQKKTRKKAVKPEVKIQN